MTYVGSLIINYQRLGFSFYLIILLAERQCEVGFVASKCKYRELLHACYRSLLACGLSVDSHAYGINLHVRWPIRTPHPTCSNQVVWAAGHRRMQDTSARNASTRTPQAKPPTRLQLSNIYFSIPLNCLWPSYLSDFGNEGELQQLKKLENGINNEPSTILQVLDELVVIVGRNMSLRSLTVGITQLCDGWNRLVIRTSQPVT